MEAAAITVAGALGKVNKDEAINVQRTISWMVAIQAVEPVCKDKNEDNHNKRKLDAIL